MINIVPLFLLSISSCMSAPIDDPVHIDLPVYDQPQINSDIQLSQAIEPENYPGGELSVDQPIGGNFINNKIQAASNLLGSSLRTKANAVNLGPFSPPVTTLESAILETEGLGSKTMSIKENIQNIVAGLFQPKPIVDTISESEKYGNSGDKFYSTGKAIVGGAEGISNIVNSVLESSALILFIFNFGSRTIDKCTYVKLAYMHPQNPSYLSFGDVAIEAYLSNF